MMFAIGFVLGVIVGFVAACLLLNLYADKVIEDMIEHRKKAGGQP